MSSTNSQVHYTVASLHLLLSRFQESCSLVARRHESEWHRGAADGYREAAKQLAQFFSGCGFVAPHPLEEDPLVRTVGEQQFLAPGAEEVAQYTQPDLRLPAATGSAIAKESKVRECTCYAARNFRELLSIAGTLQVRIRTSTTPVTRAMDGCDYRKEPIFLEWCADLSRLHLQYLADGLQRAGEMDDLRAMVITCLAHGHPAKLFEGIAGVSDLLEKALVVAGAPEGGQVGQGSFDGGPVRGAAST